jgi:hypothetical protein
MMSIFDNGNCPHRKCISTIKGKWKKYYTIATFPQSNRKIVERYKIDT